MIKIVGLRWAKGSEQLGDRWHREGFATTSDGAQVHFCGAYHPGDCSGICGLPRLVRTREDGVREAAVVAMGICPAYDQYVERGQWFGSVIEVDHPGQPVWR